MHDFILLAAKPAIAGFANYILDQESRIALPDITVRRFFVNPYYNCIIIAFYLYFNCILQAVFSDDLTHWTPN
jgi:hypothetical protein